jgi:hypothetical protein
MGQEFSSHGEKANILWVALKDRMGLFEYTHMYIDLHQLLQADLNLKSLEVPFSKEEIDRTISQLPNDKSPGPDGFNGEFLKKCWQLIADDFYNLCAGFYEGNLCLRGINSSYITLIPKNDRPFSPSDFRPISLLNSSIKLITKILAERLQEIIMRLIHKNQYGFIRSRSIHDCLAWAFEYLHICKMSKKRDGYHQA